MTAKFSQFDPANPALPIDLVGIQEGKNVRTTLVNPVFEDADGLIEVTSIDCTDIVAVEVTTNNLDANNVSTGHITTQTELMMHRATDPLGVDQTMLHTGNMDLVDTSLNRPYWYQQHTFAGLSTPTQIVNMTIPETIPAGVYELGVNIVISTSSNNSFVTLEMTDSLATEPMIISMNPTVNNGHEAFSFVTVRVQPVDGAYTATVLATLSGGGTFDVVKCHTTLQKKPHAHEVTFA